MLEMVQSAYDILDQLHLSVQMLAILGFILLVTLVLTTRELVAWFFKINSLRRELESLHESINELKQQIARSQLVSPDTRAEPTAPEKSPEPRPRQFPISH